MTEAPTYPVITVLTKPNCRQCVAVKQSLTKRGLAFTEADILEPDNLAAVQALGFAAAPVTIASFPMRDGRPNEIVFAGFNPIEIDRIADRAKLELSPSEAIKVAAFGLDRPEVTA